MQQSEASPERASVCCAGKASPCVSNLLGSLQSKPDMACAQEIRRLNLFMNSIFVSAQHVLELDFYPHSAEGETETGKESNPPVVDRASAAVPATSPCHTFAGS